MPLSQGCSLQPIHGCCGIRLPRRFWPTLPKLLSSTVVPPLPINPIRPGSQTWLTRMDILTTTVAAFGIDWSSLQHPLCIFFSPPYPYLFLLRPVLHTPLPQALSPSPFFSLFMLGCYWTDFFLARCSRASGKAPSYICQLLSLDWLHHFGSSVWVYLPTPVPPAYLLCSEIRNKWEICFVVSDPWILKPG